MKLVAPLLVATRHHRRSASRRVGRGKDFDGSLVKLLIAAALGALAFGPSALAEDWPQFRGPTGMGLTTERGLPIEWDGAKGKNVAWKVKLPGAVPDASADHNQSSPIVWRDRIFVTTAFWPPKGDHGKYPDQHVACYAARDGKLLWDTLVPPGPLKLGDLRGGYGAPTPSTDGQRVYATFGSAVLVAIDFNGHLVWRQEFENSKAFDVAIAASPIVYGSAVIQLGDRNNRQATLTAYNAADGHVLWNQKRPDVAFAHSTPVIVEHQGKPLMLIASTNALQGLDPSNGQVLWWCPTPGDVTSPTYAHGLVYTDSGRGGPGMLVEPTGRGELPKTAVKWRVGNIPEGLSSPVIAGDSIYRLHTPAVLKCFALSDGKERFAKRLEDVSTSSSPIATPDGIVYLASAGRSYVLRAGLKYELLATNELGDPAQSSPAVSGGHLILKGQQYLFSIGPKP
jgi:outer membrane protein assembly factor BamB